MHLNNLAFAQCFFLNINWLKIEWVSGLIFEDLKKKKQDNINIVVLV